MRSLTELCSLRVSVESYLSPKGPLQCKRCQRFGHTQRKCGYAPRCAACGAPTSPVDALPRGSSLCAVAAGKPHSELRGCVMWKEAKAALAKQAPERSRKSVATGRPAAPKAQRAGPYAEQRKLGEGWNHVVRGGGSSRLRRTHSTTHNQIPSSSGHEGAREAHSDRHQGDGQA